MALIHRAIFEIEDVGGDFIPRFDGHVSGWLERKFDSAFELPEDGVVNVPELGLEIACQKGRDQECEVRRISAYEGARDDDAQVKTTVTAIRSDGQSWVWIDLERWTAVHVLENWLPAPPRLLVSILDDENAYRGKTPLGSSPVLLSGNEGTQAAERIVDEDREVPIVVVSYNRGEDDGLGAAQARGRALAARLAGVAPVLVLREGAVSAFSKRMLELVGPGMDVHTGAVRTYLPGVRGEGDFHGRHKFIAFRTLARRPNDLAAYIIAPHLFRRAIEAPPPPVWRGHARDLLLASADVDTYKALLAIADGDIADRDGLVEDLRTQLEDEKQAVSDLARQLDDLVRRNRYMQAQLRDHGSTQMAAEQQETFSPELCAEVVEGARERFRFVVVPVDVHAAAWALDEHGDASWAPKAWLALAALEAYGEAKAGGGFSGDFKTCCEQSAVEPVVPSHWVARTESKVSMSNARFRKLRELPVSTNVDALGRILMEEHIKIEPGGTPCPRIYYYDDTRGATGQIHVGWFGDHLDSRAKS